MLSVKIDKRNTYRHKLQSNLLLVILTLLITIASIKAQKDTDGFQKTTSKSIYK